jgi:acyl-coenzyme A synthetase/AMP-(fatty) acid ligase
MQPQAIHWRETLPVNPNGKLDRALISQQILAENRA